MMEPTDSGAMILDTLTRACSQDSAVLTPAEHQLQQWQTQPGFYTALSSIFCNHEIAVNVRWLAVMYIKNGVEKYWRRTAPNAMREEEKDVIRQRVLANFNEPSPQICTQMAVLVAKIARVDCPRNWPSLLPTLLQTVRCDNLLLQERSLMVLHHVVKILASKRLAPDRKLFEDLTSEVFGYLYQLWQDQLGDFLQQASVHSDNMEMNIDRTTLSLKILRRLVTFGFRDPAANQEAMSFLNQVFVKLDAMLECRQSLWGNQRMLEKCERMINLLTKVLLDSLEHHPVCYIQFIQRSLEFVVRYNFSNASLLYERFTVNCFNLMKNILLCDAYRPSKHENLEPDSIKMQAYKIKMCFFTYSTLQEICHRLISQYFLLNHEDLATWDSDPEEFCQEEVGDSYRYSLRPCTETLFVSLFKEFRLTLNEILIKMVQATQGTCDVENFQTILRNDAVYHAVGQAAFDLFDDIDFDQWFTSHLLQELKISHNNYRILRRRVIWLCGQWVGVKLSAQLRPQLYAAICPLLQTSEDLVVRLEAANTLKLAVDDFEFSVEQFLPYLEVLFSLLFQLLKEVQQCDTKMQVLHVISFVIERVDVQIRPYARSLISYLPALWEEASDHNMLKCAILTTLIHLVQGFGSGSCAMYEFLLPIIELSTDTSKPEHIYLLDDGLELWHVTLINAGKVTPELLSLYKNMKNLLEISTENLRMCLKVIEDYLILEPTKFMECYSTVLVDSLSSLVTDLRPEGVILVLTVVELVFKVFPSQGPQVFAPMLPGFVQSILNQDEHPMVMSIYMTLVARVTLQNQDYFWTFIDQFSTQSHIQSTELMGLLLAAWMEGIDNMTQPEKRKLSSLALASLLTANNSGVLEKFGSIVSVCVQVLHDVCRVPVDEETAIQLDALVIADGDERGEDEHETEQEKRKRALTLKDPVHTIPLKDFVFQQLRQVHNQHGDETFDRLTRQIDPDVYLQLQQFSKT
ncbi:importin-11-like [Mya arenaria]|uniref:importin-11-like n=1 Tax=Mya arenaria TaxID=6604 RepID=UPI0022DFC5FB|nr:importin-11-like [Mya arenaria]XP_052792512.1 importin-11-like [Mya arenaria]XP_052792513.1 importin-11-like [Mya arenaria]